EDPEGPEDIDLRVAGRVLEGAPEVRLGRVVRHHLRALFAEDVGEVAAADIHRVEPRARRRAVAPAAHQRVDHRDAVTGLEVRVRHMGADEARSSGHEDPHSTVTLFARLRGWSTSCPRSLAI